MPREEGTIVSFVLCCLGENRVPLFGNWVPELVAKRPASRRIASYKNDVKRRTCRGREGEEGKV